jgi:hypothetical protein
MSSQEGVFFNPFWQNDEENLEVHLEKKPFFLPLQSGILTPEETDYPEGPIGTTIEEGEGEPLANEPLEEEPQEVFEGDSNLFNEVFSKLYNKLTNQREKSEKYSTEAFLETKAGSRFFHVERASLKFDPFEEEGEEEEMLGTDEMEEELQYRSRIIEHRAKTVETTPMCASPNGLDLKEFFEVRNFVKKRSSTMTPFPMTEQQSLNEIRARFLKIRRSLALSEKEDPLFRTKELIRKAIREYADVYDVSEWAGLNGGETVEDLVNAENFFYGNGDPYDSRVSEKSCVDHHVFDAVISNSKTVSDRLSFLLGKETNIIAPVEFESDVLEAYRVRYGEPENGAVFEYPQKMASQMKEDRNVFSRFNSERESLPNFSCFVKPVCSRILSSKVEPFDVNYVESRLRDPKDVFSHFLSVFELVITVETEYVYCVGAGQTDRDKGDLVLQGYAYDSSPETNDLGLKVTNVDFGSSKLSADFMVLESVLQSFSDHAEVGAIPSVYRKLVSDRKKTNRPVFGEEFENFSPYSVTRFSITTTFKIKFHAEKLAAVDSRGIPALLMPSAISSGTNNERKRTLPSLRASCDWKDCVMDVKCTNNWKYLSSKCILEESAEGLPFSYSCQPTFCFYPPDSETLQMMEKLVKKNSKVLSNRFFQSKCASFRWEERSAPTAYSGEILRLAGAFELFKSDLYYGSEVLTTLSVELTELIDQHINPLYKTATDVHLLVAYVKRYFGTGSLDSPPLVTDLGSETAYVSMMGLGPGAHQRNTISRKNAIMGVINVYNSNLNNLIRYSLDRFGFEVKEFHLRKISRSEREIGPKTVANRTYFRAETKKNDKTYSVDRFVVDGFEKNDSSNVNEGDPITGRVYRMKWVCRAVLVGRLRPGETNESYGADVSIYDVHDKLVYYVGLTPYEEGRATLNQIMAPCSSFVENTSDKEKRLLSRINFPDGSKKEVFYNGTSIMIPPFSSSSFGNSRFNFSVETKDGLANDTTGSPLSNDYRRFLINADVSAEGGSDPLNRLFSSWLKFGNRSIDGIGFSILCKYWIHSSLVLLMRQEIEKDEFFWFGSVWNVPADKLTSSDWGVVLKNRKVQEKMIQESMFKKMTLLMISDPDDLYPEGDDLRDLEWLSDSMIDTRTYEDGASGAKIGGNAALDKVESEMLSSSSSACKMATTFGKHECWLDPFENDPELDFYAFGRSLSKDEYRSTKELREAIKQGEYNARRPYEGETLKNTRGVSYAGKDDAFKPDVKSVDSDDKAGGKVKIKETAFTIGKSGDPKITAAEVLRVLQALALRAVQNSYDRSIWGNLFKKIQDVYTTDEKGSFEPDKIFNVEMTIFSDNVKYTNKESEEFNSLPDWVSLERSIGTAHETPDVLTSQNNVKRFKASSVASGPKDWLGESCVPVMPTFPLPGFVVGGPNWKNVFLNYNVGKYDKLYNSEYASSSSESKLDWQFSNVLGLAYECHAAISAKLDGSIDGDVSHSAFSQSKTTKNSEENMATDVAKNMRSHPFWNCTYNYLKEAGKRLHRESETRSNYESYLTWRLNLFDSVESFSRQGDDFKTNFSSRMARYVVQVKIIYWLFVYPMTLTKNQTLRTTQIVNPGDVFYNEEIFTLLEKQDKTLIENPFYGVLKRNGASDVNVIHPGLVHPSVIYSALALEKVAEKFLPFVPLSSTRGKRSASKGREEQQQQQGEEEEKMEGVPQKKGRKKAEIKFDLRAFSSHFENMNRWLATPKLIAELLMQSLLDAYMLDLEIQDYYLAPRFSNRLCSDRSINKNYINKKSDGKETGKKDHNLSFDLKINQLCLTVDHLRESGAGKSKMTKPFARLIKKHFNACATYATYSMGVTKPMGLLSQMRENGESDKSRMKKSVNEINDSYIDPEVALTWEHEGVVGRGSVVVLRRRKFAQVQEKKVKTEAESELTQKLVMLVPMGRIIVPRAEEFLEEYDKDVFNEDFKIAKSSEGSELFWSDGSFMGKERVVVQRDVNEGNVSSKLSSDRERFGRKISELSKEYKCSRYDVVLCKTDALKKGDEEPNYRLIRGRTFYKDYLTDAPTFDDSIATLNNSPVVWLREAGIQGGSSKAYVPAKRSEDDKFKVMTTTATPSTGRRGSVGRAGTPRSAAPKMKDFRTEDLPELYNSETRGIVEAGIINQLHVLIALLRFKLARSHFDGTAKGVYIERLRGKLQVYSILFRRYAENGIWSNPISSPSTLETKKACETYVFREITHAFNDSEYFTSTKIEFSKETMMGWMGLGSADTNYHPLTYSCSEEERFSRLTFGLDFLASDEKSLRDLRVSSSGIIPRYSRFCDTKYTIPNFKSSSSMANALSNVQCKIVRKVPANMSVKVLRSEPLLSDVGQARREELYSKGILKKSIVYPVPFWAEYSAFFESCVLDWILNGTKFPEKLSLNSTMDKEYNVSSTFNACLDVLRSDSFERYKRGEGGHAIKLLLEGLDFIKKGFKGKPMDVASVSSDAPTFVPQVLSLSHFSKRHDEIFRAQKASASGVLKTKKEDQERGVPKKKRIDMTKEERRAEKERIRKEKEEAAEIVRKQAIRKKYGYVAPLLKVLFDRFLNTPSVLRRVSQENLDVDSVQKRMADAFFLNENAFRQILCLDALDAVIVKGGGVEKCAIWIQTNPSIPFSADTKEGDENILKTAAENFGNLGGGVGYSNTEKARRRSASFFVASCSSVNLGSYVYFPGLNVWFSSYLSPQFVPFEKYTKNYIEDDFVKIGPNTLTYENPSSPDFVPFKRTESESKDAEGGEETILPDAFGAVEGILFCPESSEGKLFLRGIKNDLSDLRATFSGHSPRLPSSPLLDDGKAFTLYHVLSFLIGGEKIEEANVRQTTPSSTARFEKGVYKKMTLNLFLDGSAAYYPVCVCALPFIYAEKTHPLAFEYRQTIERMMNYISDDAKNQLQQNFQRLGQGMKRFYESFQNLYANSNDDLGSIIGTNVEAFYATCEKIKERYFYVKAMINSLYSILKNEITGGITTSTCHLECGFTKSYVPVVHFKLFDSPNSGFSDMVHNNGVRLLIRHSGDPNYPLFSGKLRLVNDGIVEESLKKVPEGVSVRSVKSSFAMRTPVAVVKQPIRGPVSVAPGKKPFTFIHLHESSVPFEDKGDIISAGQFSEKALRTKTEEFLRTLLGVVESGELIVSARPELLNDKVVVNEKGGLPEVGILRHYQKLYGKMESWIHVSNWFDQMTLFKTGQYSTAENKLKETFEFLLVARYIFWFDKERAREKEDGYRSQAFESALSGSTRIRPVILGGKKEYNGEFYYDMEHSWVETESTTSGGFRELPATHLKKIVDDSLKTLWDFGELSSIGVSDSAEKNKLEVLFYERSEEDGVTIKEKSTHLINFSSDEKKSLLFHYPQVYESRLDNPIGSKEAGEALKKGEKLKKDSMTERLAGFYTHTEDDYGAVLRQVRDALKWTEKGQSSRLFYVNQVCRFYVYPAYERDPSKKDVSRGSLFGHLLQGLKTSQKAPKTFDYEEENWLKLYDETWGNWEFKFVSDDLKLSRFPLSNEFYYVKNKRSKIQRKIDAYRIKGDGDRNLNAFATIYYKFLICSAALQIALERKGRASISDFQNLVCTAQSEGSAFRYVPAKSGARVVLETDRLDPEGNRINFQLARNTLRTHYPIDSVTMTRVWERFQRCNAGFRKGELCTVNVNSKNRENALTNCAKELLASSYVPENKSATSEEKRNDFKRIYSETLEKVYSVTVLQGVVKGTAPPKKKAPVALPSSAATTTTSTTTTTTTSPERKRKRASSGPRKTVLPSPPTETTTTTTTTAAVQKPKPPPTSTPSKKPRKTKSPVMTTTTTTTAAQQVDSEEALAMQRYMRLYGK